MLGSFAYKKIPPKENVIFRVVKTIKTALVNKFRKGAPKRAHWLDHSLDKHSCATDVKCNDAQTKPFYTSLCLEARFVEDVKSLIRVLIMMLPVPFFWSLYDQQGSRWVIQAVAMDGQITDNFALLPDQMATLNAILIMTFIPIFQFLIYPGVEKMGIRTHYLRRMVVGGFLAAMAFVISGFVQIGVNQTLPDIPKNDVAFVSLINSYGSNCNVAFNIPGASQTILPRNTSLIDNKVEKIQTLLRLKPNTYLIQITSTGDCQGNQGAITLTTNFEGGKSYYVAATPQGVFYDSTKWDKPTEGQGESSLRMTLLSPCNTIVNSTVRSWGCNDSSDTSSYFGRIALCRYNPENIEHPCDPRDTSKYFYYAWKSEGDDYKRIPVYDYNGGGNVKANGTAYDFIDMKPGIYKAYYVNYLLGDSDRTPAKEEIAVVEIPGSTFQITGMGGVYSLIILKNGQVSSNTPASNVLSIYTIVPRNHLSIMWQIPQYIVITAAEILFSITGLEFCYSQAAPSMKSVLQAAWCFTVALGDLIIIIIAELSLFPNLAIEMFAYACGMLVVIFIFALMSIFYYEYVDYTAAEDEAVSDLIPKEPSLQTVSKHIDNESDASMHL
uniref:Uncharacterized protein n=1 Tax=Panagrolaimus sp. ES5 TaxID=591445 RepID=A0AC34GTB2_9BILA